MCKARGSRGYSRSLACLYGPNGTPLRRRGAYRSHKAAVCCCAAFTPMSQAQWARSVQEQPRRCGLASPSWLGSPEPRFCGLETTATKGTPALAGSRSLAAPNRAGPVIDIRNFLGVRQRGPPLFQATCVLCKMLFSRASWQHWPATLWCHCTRLAAWLRAGDYRLGVGRFLVDVSPVEEDSLPVSPGPGGLEFLLHNGGHDAPA